MNIPSIYNRTRCHQRPQGVANPAQYAPFFSFQRGPMFLVSVRGGYVQYREQSVATKGWLPLPGPAQFRGLGLSIVPTSKRRVKRTNPDCLSTGHGLGQSKNAHIHRRSACALNDENIPSPFPAVLQMTRGRTDFPIETR